MQAMARLKGYYESQSIMLFSMIVDVQNAKTLKQAKLAIANVNERRAKLADERL